MRRLINLLLGILFVILAIKITFKLLKIIFILFIIYLIYDFVKRK